MWLPRMLGDRPKVASVTAEGAPRAMTATDETAVTSEFVTDRIPVIDVDAHIIEPADIWTSRMSKKYADIMPRVERHTGSTHSEHGYEDYWLIGKEPVSCAWELAQSGWDGKWPTHPAIQEEVDPATYIPDLRARKLD